MASKTTNSEMFLKNVDQLKANLDKLHNGALTMAEQMVDYSLNVGNDWQAFMAKALQKGTEVMEKQQDATLDMLEEVKSQYQQGKLPFQQLLGYGEAGEVKKVVEERLTQVEVALDTAGKESVTESAQDDLTKIKGIGPKVAILLNEAGIHTYAQLVDTPAVKLQEILQQAGSRYRSMDPTPWISMAKESLN
ncbi:MAG: helix-hairpin-helix domain-containing protein [Bacteroidota bacterium]